MTKTRAVCPSVTDRDLLDAVSQFVGGAWYTYLDGSYFCTAVKNSDSRTMPRSIRRSRGTGR